jgi:preprotein translocase subunit YajC
VLGRHILAAANSGTTGKTSGSFEELLLFMVLLFGIFYFVMIRPQRNRQRQAQQRQQEAQPGARIRTTAGIYGTLVSGDERDVVVEIAPGVEITMLRRAIMEVVPDEDESGVPPAETLDDQADDHDAEHADAEDEAPAGEAETEDVSAGDSADRAK